MNGLAEVIRVDAPKKEIKSEQFCMLLTPTEHDQLSELCFYSGKSRAAFLRYCIEVSHKQMKEQQTNNTEG